MLINIHILHLGIIILISIISYYVINKCFKIKIGKHTFIQIVFLINPWPLFLVSPGAAGFVYSADLLAIYYLTKRKSYTIRKSTIPLVSILLILYFFQPLFNSLSSFTSATSNEIKFFILQIIRGGLYILIYLHFFSLNSTQHIKNILLSIAIWWFFYLFTCFLHYSDVITLSDNFLPKTIFDPNDFGKISRGTFGLYRGALGAMACIILFIGLPLLIEKTNIIFTASFIILTLLIEVFCGSRMSIIFSSGYIIYFLVSRRQYLSKKILLILCVLLLIMNITFISSFNNYFEIFKFRFNDQFLNQRNNYENIFVQRDERITFILGDESNDLRLIFGNALNYRYVDSEFFLIFQKNGVVGLILYFIFILTNLIFLTKKNITLYLGGKWFAIALFGTCVFIPFHFYIYCTFTHQAVSSYVLYALYGVWLYIPTRIYRPLVKYNFDNFILVNYKRKRLKHTGASKAKIDISFTRTSDLR